MGFFIKVVSNQNLAFSVTETWTQSWMATPFVSWAKTPD